MERYVLSGRSGFLGSALSAELLSQGHQVQSLCRDFTEVPEADHYIDLAAYGNYSDQTDIEQIYEANVMRLTRFIKGAEQYPYKSFITTSSGSVHLKPNFYSASKLATEQLVRAYAIQRNKPILALRPFSVTGVGEQPRHLIPTLIRSCIEGEQMPFIGSPVHDFVDIEDLVQAYIVAGSRANSLKGGAFDVGRGESYKNSEVRSIVEQVTKQKANIVVSRKLRDYDSPVWAAETNDLCKIGYLPTKNLRQSIKEMVNEYRK